MAVLEKVVTETPTPPTRNDDQQREKDADEKRREKRQGHRKMGDPVGEADGDRLTVFESEHPGGDDERQGEEGCDETTKAV